MSEKTFHVTQEDLRKMESKESKFHGGTTPKDSDTSALKASSSPLGTLLSSWPVADPAIQSIIAERQESKNERIERVKANLPLPDDPPGSADLESADARTVNVGSGRISDDISGNKGSSSGLREPATADSSVRTDGETWKTNTAP